MQKITCLAILLIINLSANCQVYYDSGQVDLDSLKRLLPGAEIGTKIEIINALAYHLAPYNFDSSIKYSSQAMRLATQNGFQKQIGVARYNLGNAYYYQRDFKNALFSYFSALKIFEENQFVEVTGKVYIQLGHINFFILRTEKAITYYRKALSAMQASGNNNSLPEIFHAICLTYWRDGAGDSALVYADHMLKYAEKYKDASMKAMALTLFGLIYPDERAIYNCNAALEITIRLKDTILTAILYNNLASFYDRSSSNFEKYGNFILSRSYYNRALRQLSGTGYTILNAMVPAYLAEIDIEEGKYQMAEVNLELSERQLKAFFRFPASTSAHGRYFSFGKIWDYYLLLRTRGDVYSARYKLARLKGEMEKAFEYQQLYYQSIDSLNAEQEGRQLELLIAEDEAERQDEKLRKFAQESEMSQLKLSRSRFIFISGGIGLLLMSMVLLLLIQRRKIKAERQSVLMEQRLLRAQMNPHFIFNSLASIQNFVINENSDQASIYLSRFSQLVRNILDNSVEEYVPIEKEISTIENYLELQKVRYADKFDYSIMVDERIDDENMMIPPMLAQPFIENAIEHGIRHKRMYGHISVRFNLEDGFIRFEVEDDGVGREKAAELEAEQSTRHVSMATSITQDRLLTLNKKLKKKIRMEIIDLKDDSGEGCGTRVEFGIPVVVK